jgi:putative copper resistance protein D
VALLTLGIAVVVTGQTPRPAPAGLPDAGALTAWAVVVSRTLLRVAAVGTVGSLLVAGWLCSADPMVAPSAVRRLTRAASRWSIGWVLAAVLLMVSSSAQLLGIPLRSALTTYAVWGYVPQLAEGRALMLMSPMVLLIALHAGRLGSRRGLHLMLALALLALAPLTLTGHAASAGNHYLATQSLLLHIVAVTLWVGGLVGLLHVRRDATLLAPAVRRFSSVALACFVMVAVTGVVSASTSLGLDVNAWRSAYGALVLTKVLAFGLLGLAGGLHRRHTIPALAAGRPLFFWRLAGVEILLMSAAMGLAVALSRTPPPVRAGVVATPHPASTVDRGLAAVNPVGLLTEWRPEALVVTAIAAVSLLHLAAAWARVRIGRNEAWSAAGWFVAGSLLLLWALCGGLAAYGSAVLSAHVAQLLVCAVVVPRLWARGVRDLGASPDGACSADAWPLRAVARVDGALVLALVLAGVYATPVLEMSLRNGSIHLVVDVAALAAGVAGSSWRGAADADHQHRGHRSVAGVLAAFGIAMFLTRRVLAGQWFDALDWSWSDPATDQHLAALLLAGAGVLLYAGSFVPVRPVSRQRVAVGSEPRASMACR